MKLSFTPTSMSIRKPIFTGSNSRPWGLLGTEFLLTRSPWNDLYGEVRVASDEEARDPPGRLFGVEGDAAGAFEQHGEHDPSLEAGEGRADAVVDATPERDVAARRWPIEDDLIRPFVFGGISVGGAPKQQ